MPQNWCGTLSQYKRWHGIPPNPFDVEGMENRALATQW